VNQLGPVQLDLISAAFRHASDSERLAATSADQTFHLAGLALECIQKATLVDASLNRAIGHVGDPSSEVAWSSARALDPWCRRYALDVDTIPEWFIECRYERTGTRKKQDATKALETAWSAWDLIACALFVDGRIPRGFEW